MSAAILVVLVLAVTAGCGGSNAPAPPPVATSSAPADPCAPPVPPQQPALHLCVSGALTGSALVPSREATSCTGPVGGFSGTFVTLINSRETRLELTDNQGAGSFDLTDPAADVTVTVVQDGQQSWSSIGGNRSGTVTFAADRSGSLDVTLAQRDLATGGEVPDAPALRVRGTFRCPA